MIARQDRSGRWRGTKDLGHPLSFDPAQPTSSAAASNSMKEVFKAGLMAQEFAQ
jgi:hypothetical protein